MTVKVRPYKNGGWEVDIVVQLDNGEVIRRRFKSPVSSKSGSLSWGQGRERHLVKHGLEPKPEKKHSALAASPANDQREGTHRKEVPTLAEFMPRYMEGYVRANRQKMTTHDSKLLIFSNHLIPRFGSKRIDEIGDEDVQQLKAAMADKSPKTVNNVLSTLSTLLKAAVEWGVIEQVPANIRLLKVHKKEMAFFDFDEYDRLVEAAGKIEPWLRLMIMLGGDAGLRPGEVRALHWTSVDFSRRRITVERNEYKGGFTLPKHDKIRRVPMTEALTAALKDHRHLRGPLVLPNDEGKPVTAKYQRYWLGKALRRANLPDHGPHTLRHTFCSHLAMRGAPARAIMELAGHADLTTTQGYMHLSPAALEASIGLLDRRSSKLSTNHEKRPAQEVLSEFGDILETGRS